MRLVGSFLCLGLAALSCAGPGSNMSSNTPAAPLPKATAVADVPAGDDPYLWLEEVGGEKALAWVQAQNARSLKDLGTPEQAALKKRLLAIYDSKDRIPYGTNRGRHVYNFWTDDKHVRGLWRRTSLAEYGKRSPRWEVLLDIDALGKADKENWVWKGAACLRPDYERCLLSLSRGGGDAVVVREFNTRTRQFVKDGFQLAEAKSDVSWKDQDTVYVGTDFGPGSLTSSGYPRVVKEWKRGAPLAQARTIFEGAVGDVSVSAYRDWHQGRHLDLVERAVTFYESETFILDEGKPTKLDRPADAISSYFADFLLLQLRSDWTVNGRKWPAGALLAANLADYRAGKRDLHLLYEPGPNHSLSSYSGTKNHLLLNIMKDVRTEVRVMTWQSGKDGGKWSVADLPSPGLGTYGAAAFDEDLDDRYWFDVDDFIQPARRELGDLATGKRVVMKSGPSFFDADGLETRQFFVASKDGTRIPYFQVARKDLALDGSNPVLLTGYGGFEVPLLPGYDPTVGAAWLEQGGVYVVANIRGGGEYGPAWHQAGLKHHRQRVYEDFIAVAGDLIARKVTSPRKLGIEGGSNGGLLMGVMFTQRPELWGAVVCSVPLLDMRRYHKLLAGASWMGEYGDPDKPEDWAAIARYSPYQNVKKGVAYPRVLFTTSTRDDRVHPGHARKMVARMLEQGHDLLYFENTEGGHAGAADNPQRAHLNALAYTYLKLQLMK
jgi:prolyl oligopeptidase